MKGRTARQALVLLTLFAAYVAAGKLGLRFASIHPSATAVWAPTGIALAVFLVLGARVWPAIFLGAFVVNITTEGSFWTTLAIAAGNTFEGFLGARLVNRFASGRQAYDRALDVLKAALLAGLLSTVVSPTVGVASLSLGGYADWRNFGPIWLTWWLGDVGGDLVVAPFLVLWFNSRRLEWSARKSAEALAVLVGLLGVQQLVFGGSPGVGMQRYPLEYLAIPFFVWIAIRFDPREAATATFLSSTIAVLGTAQGYGPFNAGGRNESLLLLAAYTSVMSITVMALAAEVAEGRRVERERRRLISELESQRRLLEVVIQHLPEGIVVRGASGELLYCNENAELILGDHLPQTIGEESWSPANAFTLDGLPLPRELWPMERALKKGEVVANEDLLFRSAGGVRRVLRADAVPVRDQEGGIVAAVTSYHDVTERRRAVDALVFLSEAGAVLSASLDYETTLASVARLVVPRIADWCAVDLLTETGALRQLAVAHIDPAKVELARDLNRRYPPDPNSPLGAPQVIRTGKAELIEEISNNSMLSSAWDEEHRRILRELGFVSFMCVPLTARGRTFGAFSFTSAESGRHFDAADLNLAGQLAGLATNAVDNAWLYAEAEKAIRVRDEFLSVAGHELRTPLNSAHLLVESLLRQAPAREPADRFAGQLKRIESSIERISGLVDELLDVSRISAGRLSLELEEGVDLGAVAQDAAAGLEEELRRAGCTVSLRARRVLGRWDRRRLEQMVTNLLSNAIKYGRGKPIEIEVDSDGDRARLRVRDHGIGISPQDRSRIFLQFERAVSGRHYGGLGLGLWIVRQIAEALGGSISVESEPGKGSTFTAELPCTKFAVTSP
jgi:PAS domain S-box-containing protein